LPEFKSFGFNINGKLGQKRCHSCYKNYELILDSVYQVIGIKYPIIGEIPYPINGTGKLPKIVEIKIIIKYNPTQIEGNLRSFGGNNINGTGRIASEIIPKVSHTNPILFNKLIIFST
jgi:hypothetical protein